MEKKISRQIFFWAFIWFIILGVAIAFVGHLEMGAEKGILLNFLASISEHAAGALSIEHLYWVVLAIILAVTGLFMWLSLKISIKRTITAFKNEAESTSKDKKPKKTPKPVQEKKIKQGDDQRRALHMLCLLQREGRLVDFLQEDLQLYDDAQIGAAVRSIQENCRKSLNEYLALQAVIDQEEGEEITVQAGFDANTIKLTGNISGEPPFKGILQHRGWQISKFSLPELSGTQNPKIIAPAEVEIN